ncbi:MAG: hypothetical protein CMI00_02890 [Oceanospirillaceae bacterium]|nr:hypothetical protein [Oceanospirillaceae bacterium]|tara:strand:+ start:1300 stop:1710 length:411 start_codon:yes stop_codon:yes gene_type:complete
MEIKQRSIIIFLLCFLLSLTSNACIVPPSQRITSEEARFFDKADVVFFGRLDAEHIDDNAIKQTAVFTVIKSYKGNTRGKVTVINRMTSSCSRPFEKPGSAYYIYAQTTDDESSYLIDGFASFVSLEDAQSYHWSP